jgi:hypothetical protein
MKVVDKRSFTGERFDKFSVGDTFIYDYEVYMKMGTMKCPHTGEQGNAINLATGTIVFFSANEHITPVRCELTLMD